MAQRAITKILGQAHNLVICDFDMHPTDGLAVLSTVTVMPVDARPAFVMPSGGRNSTRLTQALAAGADACLSKPFTARQLVSATVLAIELSAYMGRSGPPCDPQLVDETRRVLKVMRHLGSLPRCNASRG